MDRNFPVEILVTLEKWFDMSVGLTCVRWCDLSSNKLLQASHGVRRWSPVLFAILIDSLITKVMVTKVGCYPIWICIFLFADDIILLSPTVTGLQTLLTAVKNELHDIDMQLI